MEQFIDKSSAARLRNLLLRDDRPTLTGALWILIALVAVICGAVLAFLTPIGGAALLVSGAAALLMLRDLRWGLLALIAVACLLPFASLPFKVGFTPTFLDLVFGALYAVWAVRLITRTQDDLVLTPLGLPLIVFIALALFSFLRGLAHARPTANDLRTFSEILMGMGIFFLVVNNVRRESLLRMLTAAIIVGGALESLIGVIFYALPASWTVRLLNPLGRLGYPVGYGALRYINDDPDRPMRAIATSVDPNILGAMLVIILTIAAVQLVARHPVMPRLWLGLSVGLMSLCLFLTYSRGSLVGAVAALGLVAALRYRRLLVILILGLGLLFLLPQTQAYVSHFIQGVEVEERSMQMRMGEYRDALKLIQRYPWLGVGFVGAPDIDLYLGVASIYFTLASQMGLVGLLSFLLVMVTFFTVMGTAWIRLPSGAAMEPMLLGYGAAVFGSLIGGLADHTLLTYPHATALLWLTVALALVAVRLGKSSRKFHGHHKY